MSAYEMSASSKGGFQLLGVEGIEVNCNQL